MKNENMKNESETLNEDAFLDAINFEWVNYHHKPEDGEIKPGPWCQRIIAHAQQNGFTGEITQEDACEIINRTQGFGMN